MSIFIFLLLDGLLLSSRIYTATRSRGSLLTPMCINNMIVVRQKIHFFTKRKNIVDRTKFV